MIYAVQFQNGGHSLGGKNGALHGHSLGGENVSNNFGKIFNLIHPYGKYVTLAIEPRFRVSDIS